MRSVSRAPMNWPEPFVQLLDDEAVERDAAIEQPVEGRDVQAGDHAPAHRLDVVAIDLPLDHRALAEPAARRQAGEGDRHADAARAAVVAHLQQAVDHAEPVGHRPADAAQQFAGIDLHDLHASSTAASCSFGIERAQPGNAGQLVSRFGGAPASATARSRRGSKRACHHRETPKGTVPRIVVRPTTWRQTCSYIALERPPEETTRAHHLPPLDARSRGPAADAPALREKEFGIWQTLSWRALAALVRASPRACRSRA